MSSETPDISVVLPTMNESENIREVVSGVFGSCRDFHIEVIVVDDGSTDGTIEIVEEMARGLDIKLISRGRRMGISSALLDGFESAKGKVLGAMDADLSHPPETIPRLVRPILDGDADMTIGSRYRGEGGTVNWPRSRWLISKAATFLVRPLTGASDPMSGLFFMRNDILKGEELSRRGWKLCLDILVRTRPERVVEIPYTFRDRRGGSTKMGPGTIMDFMINVLDLYVHRLFGSSLGSLIKFSTVGGIGVLLNLEIVYALVEYLSIDYRISATASFFIVAINNFFWNKIWSFRDRRTAPRVVGRQLARYVLTSLVSLAINLAVLTSLVELFGIYYLAAQLMAIAVAVTANFTVNSRWVFRGRERR
jgi:dolichol-phosphate mannosyltransferase